MENFENLLPVIREVVFYLKHVINENNVEEFTESINSILSAHYMRMPFINLWIAYLLQNSCFQKVNIPESYDVFLSVREKALVALRCKDANWVRNFRDSMDALGPWDKRAVLYSSLTLPEDEMRAWTRSVGESGNIIDKSIVSFIISKKKADKLVDRIT